MNFQDEKRAIQLTTPLGPGKLLVAQFQGREAVSELFRFHIDAQPAQTA